MFLGEVTVTLLDIIRMDIQSERVFFDVIKRVGNKMKDRLGNELTEKVEFLWKRNLTRVFSQRYKRKPKPNSEGNGSDDEYLLPECNNVIYTNFIKLRKEKPYWRVKMTGGIYQRENLNESVLSKVSLVAKSDFFND
jgi:hypothetical protein